jgi:signal transduction histidine kinase
LLLAELRAGHCPVRRVPCAIADLVEEARDWGQTLAADKDVKVCVDLPPFPLPAVHTDPAKLACILRNLVTNAVKFTPKGTVRIGLGVIERGRWLEVQVRDNGPGIPPELVEQVFEPFWQEDLSLTRRAGGLGIGLALARELAERLGGELRCQSTPGAGALFLLRLPLEPTLMSEAEWRELVSPAIWNATAKVTH